MQSSIDPLGVKLMKLLFDAQSFERSYRACFNAEPSSDDLFMVYLGCASNVRIRPNEWFDEFEYRSKYRDVDLAIRKGEFEFGFQHWCSHGCVEGRDPVLPILRPELLPETLFRAIEHNFDKTSYERQSGRQFDTQEDAIIHFLSVGVAHGINPFPSNFFDEVFYCRYYRDVQAAIDANRLPCGLFHFLARGFTEGRIGFNDRSSLLAKKLGDAASTGAIDNVSNLERKLAEPVVCVDRRCKPRVNLFVPSLDGDIMFGGYIAFLHFARALAKRGLKLRFVVTDDLFLSKEWCLQSLSESEFQGLIRDAEFINITSKESEIKCSPLDINIAYSTWAASAAFRIASKLRRKHIISFIQEYEPIFYAHSSNHFLSASAYTVPQVGIFNSDVLLRYFSKRQIGKFREGINSISFEHSLNAIPASAESMRRLDRRRGLLCYARPEAHASRNLFEIVVLAVRRAVELGYIDSTWNITGIGSLQDIEPIELGRGCSMRILSKLSFGDYTNLLREYDVGLSLMWAPHPSVVPFEMASAGMVAVTNSFENRPPSWFKKFGSNVVAVQPSLDAIVSGIGIAVARATDFEKRLQDAKRIKTAPWSDVFGLKFTDTVLEMFDKYK